MINLRYLEEKDLPRCRELRNKNRKWFYDDGVISEERHRTWFESVKYDYGFRVIELDGKVIGTISTRYVDGEIEVGNLTLDDAYRGHGYMTEAVRQVTKNEGSYFATTLPSNIKSQGVFERAGFKKCGTTKDGQVVLRLYV